MAINIDNFFCGILNETSNVSTTKNILLEANDDPTKYALGNDDTSSSKTDAPASTDDSKYALPADDATDADSSADPSADTAEPDIGDTASTGEDDINDDNTDADNPIDNNTDEQDNIDADVPAPVDGSPDIKILNLSDKDKQLNNLKLFKRFRELHDNTVSALTTITNRNGRTPTEQQIMDFVATNLTAMVDELEIFMTAKYSDVYETNTTTYLLYLQRYKVAMSTIRIAYDKLSENEEK